MICASLKFAYSVRILLGHFCRKNSTFEHHYFSGGLSPRFMGPGPQISFVRSRSLGSEGLALRYLLKFR